MLSSGNDSSAPADIDEGRETVVEVCLAVRGRDLDSDAGLTCTHSHNTGINTLGQFLHKSTKEDNTYSRQRLLKCLTFWHHWITEPNHIYPSLQHLICKFPSQTGIPQHHRNNGMVVALATGVWPHIMSLALHSTQCIPSGGSQPPAGQSGSRWCWSGASPPAQSHP